MAKLQDQLRTTGRATIRMQEYLQSLVQTLEESYGRPGVALGVAVAPLTLDADRASWVGLILTELVTNAFKHAFPANQPGRIEVRLDRLGERYVLSVADTGAGLPVGLDVERQPSVGLRLVHLLSERLRGELTTTAREGTTFTVSFSVPEEAPTGDR
jgi:two-component sensor histidine kinase